MAIENWHPVSAPERSKPTAGSPPPIEPAIKLATAIATFKRWLYLPDPAPLLAVLGTVAANRLPGDPTWLMLISAPSGGKTELIQPLRSLPYVHLTSTLTEASLLSATPRRDKTKDSTGGLLRAIGDFGILLCKDFTSVLAMNRDTRASVLAALREIYDGHWARHVGVDGGRTLEWRGKLGLIAACTGIIDSYHGVISLMGERFVMLRLAPGDENQIALRALQHQGSESIMRQELERAVAGLYADSPSPPPRCDEQETERLVALATFAVKCRSAVERDGRTREVELIPEAEAPGRLALALSRLLAGLSAIGASRSDAWKVVAKVALDSLPALRLRVIQMLYSAPDSADTTAISAAVQYPTSTTRRALEDLTAHGVITRASRGQGRADHWTLSPWTQTKCTAADITFPETSEEVKEDTFPEMSVEE